MSNECYNYYEKNTKSFASQIEKLFRNNKVVNEEDFPQVTFEAYMILLFEIARRSVPSVESPSKKKKQLDSLPIGSAVARLVELLEFGSDKICTFDDVFLPKGKLNCFTDPNPLERRKAIDEINKTTLERREAIDKINESTHLQELSEMFYSEERQVDKLAEKMKRDLNVKD